MMDKKIFLIGLLLFIPLVSALPGDWWGKVYVNNVSIVSGPVVKAMISGIEVSNATVGEFTSSYYLLHVEGIPNTNISFKVYDMNESRSVLWSVGNHAQFDLNVSTLVDGSICNYAQSCTGSYCVHNRCRSSNVYCGDGYCDGGESCTSDCGSTTSNSGGGGSSTTYKIVQNVTVTSSCIPDWGCGSWQSCTSDSKMSRSCIDSKNCNTTLNRPWVKVSCVYFDEADKKVVNNVDEQVSEITNIPEVKDVLKKAIDSQGLTNIGDLSVERIFSQDVISSVSNLKSFDELINYSRTFVPYSVYEWADAYKIGDEYVTVYSFEVDTTVLNESVVLVENIPKSVANDVSLVQFSNSPTVLKNDPVVKWAFPVQTKKKISYAVVGYKSDNPDSIAYYVNQDSTKLFNDWIVKNKYILNYFVMAIASLLIIIIGRKTINVIKQKRKDYKPKQKTDYTTNIIPQDLQPLYNHILKNIKNKSQQKIIQEARRAGWTDDDIVTVFELIRKHNKF